MASRSAGSTDRRLALFPLNVVLFPGGLLPLRIFEPRYQRMVSECLREQQPFVVAAIVDGAEAGDVAVSAPSGTLARIIDWEQLDDGLLGLLCEGGEVVDIADVAVESDRLLRASALPRPLAAPRSLPPEMAWLGELLDELLERLGAPYDRLRRPQPDAGHVANRLIELLPLPIAEKQRLFELQDDGLRLQRLAGMIHRSAASVQ